MSKLLLITILTTCLVNFSKTQSSYTVFEKVKSGFKLAESFLRLDRSSGVAKLVADTFGNLTGGGSKNKDSSGSSFVMGFFRVLGFNAKKIGAIAVNGLIFLAQLLGTSLSLKPPSRLLKARNMKGISMENSMLWMLENTEALKMISHATEKNLPNQIIEYVKERSLDEETGCIQMLICKTAPFVWGMQKVLTTAVKENVTKNGEKSRGKAVFSHYLPSYSELWNQSDECDKTHHYCFYDEL